MRKLLVLLLGLCLGLVTWLGYAQLRPLSAAPTGGFVKLNLKLPFTQTAQDYWVQKDGHYYVYQDDIIVGDDFPKMRANLRDDGNRLWNNGQIPVEFDNSLSAITRINCCESLNWLNNNSNVCYRNRLATDKDYVLITRYTGSQPKGGSSYTGRKGGAQILFINGDQPKSVILHELLHAAGLYHEQSRSDRDTYVKIIEDNILGDFKYNFDKKGDRFGDYDMSSLMHYRDNAFGKGNPTATTIKCYDAQRHVVPCPAAMGNGDYPSTKDLAGVNYLYRKFSTFCAGFDATYTEAVDASVVGTLTGTISWQKSMGQPTVLAPANGRVGYVAMQLVLPKEALVSWHNGVKTVKSYARYGNFGTVVYLATTESATRQSVTYRLDQVPVNVPLKLTLTADAAAWGKFPPHGPARPHESFTYQLDAAPSGSTNPVINAANKTSYLDFVLTGHWESTVRFPQPQVRPITVVVNLRDKLRQKHDWGKTGPTASYNTRQGKLVVDKLGRQATVGTATR